MMLQRGSSLSRAEPSGVPMGHVAGAAAGQQDAASAEEIPRIQEFSAGLQPGEELRPEKQSEHHRFGKGGNTTGEDLRPEEQSEHHRFGKAGNTTGDSRPEKQSEHHRFGKGGNTTTGEDLRP